MKKKAAFGLAAAVAVLAIASGIYAVTHRPGHHTPAAHSSHEQGQIQAPPHPLRTKPLERVVVGSK